jgi:hypothetical protein
VVEFSSPKGKTGVRILVGPQMIKKLNMFGANVLFLLHCLLGIFLLCGWWFPQIRFVYLAVLLAWLSSWIFLGYCPLTKWEFTLRRKYNNEINPNNEAIQYYAYKFFKKHIPAQAIFTGGLIVFIILTLLTLIKQ